MSNFDLNDEMQDTHNCGLSTKSLCVPRKYSKSILQRIVLGA